MVFAPPLLAFVLSLMSRNNTKATRTAFLAGCAGQRRKRTDEATCDDPKGA